MNTTDVIYSSYAIPPEGIKVGRTYQFGKDKSGCYISDILGNQHMDIEYIKALFSPVNETWEDVLSVKKAADKE